MQKNIKSLIFVVEKKYPVSNHMFKIDIENTRTRCQICSKHKDNITFFLLLPFNMYWFAR